MIKLSKQARFKYVAELDTNIQEQIKKAITEALTASGEYTDEVLDDAMCSKVYDLEDTITIKYI